MDGEIELINFKYCLLISLMVTIDTAAAAATKAVPLMYHSAAINLIEFCPQLALTGSPRLDRVKNCGLLSCGMKFAE